MARRIKILACLMLAAAVPAPSASAEDVVVYTATDGRDIAVAGIQWCGGPRDDPGAEHGLMLWDVTNPAAPTQIGYLRTACCTRAPT